MAGRRFVGLLRGDPDDMNPGDLEIDLVYLWVDGGDPAWLAKKIAVTGVSGGNVDKRAAERDGKARYESNDELKYALRSAEKFAPWIRKILIVTDGQVPAWLDTSNPRVHLVDHKEIMSPEALPCFNSSVIEYFLYRIPGLSEHFLLSNDDNFFGAPLSPDYFFAADGYPIVRLKKKYFGKLRFLVKRALKIGFGQYRRMLFRSARLVEERAGKYYSDIPHHNIDAYRKSDYKRAVEEVFADEIVRCQGHHTRTDGDFHRSAIGLYALAVEHAHLKNVGSESTRIGVQNSDFMHYIRSRKPNLFCLNDNQRATDEDRARIKPFLEELFPERSQFEKHS